MIAIATESLLCAVVRNGQSVQKDDSVLEYSRVVDFVAREHNWRIESSEFEEESFDL